jgi:hypothetical protein
MHRSAPSGSLKFPQAPAFAQIGIAVVSFEYCCRCVRDRYVRSGSQGMSPGVALRFLPKMDHVLVSDDSRNSVSFPSFHRVFVQ